ncbi:hypothetical protein KO481_35800 [Nocardia sp. NEAU-G5]|uniref:HK97 gp10 family phage protein n=1 Tax=Nocardia albiluteola TaxID=2842303 RepID=A0ABS6B998_9NOCA|nr:hypothetical protein [Nocardia albiluteola]MBU3066872.1 hypothetical protein [Nocardia albiluteola]
MSYDLLHDAMHRLPGFPDHEAAADRNTNRPGRVRAVRWNTRGNAAGKARARRWNTDGNEAAAVRAARWNSNARAERNHAEAPRVFVSLQESIARRLGQGERR